MSEQISSYQQPVRPAFPDDEARLPWLSRLLDAYFIIDEGISVAIGNERERGRELACARGCSSCCTTHQDIPVYPLELMGMSWYVIEKLESGLRARLKTRLEDVTQIRGCPFLLDGACSIHPMRPIACRQFNVLDRPCSEGEDAFHTRRDDVMMPIKSYTDEAFDRMLPFYGITSPDKRREALEQGILHAVAREMRECQWHNLPARMQQFDQQQDKKSDEHDGDL